MPHVQELAGSGIVVVDEVDIAAYGRRTVEQLRFDLPVEDVMTLDVVSIRADAPVRAAVERLLGREFRALPVVDDSNRVVGVVSSGDLVARGGLGARLEIVSAMRDEARETLLVRLPDRPVSEAMTPDPAMVRTTDTLVAATHLMAERRLKRVPVVDRAGALAGVLARMDVLRAVAETFPRDVVDASEHAGARTIGELMRADAPTVAADTDLGGLLAAVASTRLNRAIVLDADGRVLGVVSDADVVAQVDPSAGSGVIGALMRVSGQAAGARKTAAELVSGPPLAVGPGTTIAEAARLTLESRQKVLCVVDEARRLLGIVDRADLLHAARGALQELAAPVGDRPDGG
jgi:CBS-domain-containing membrane protein